jgi:hypothetical protein
LQLAQQMHIKTEKLIVGLITAISFIMALFCIKEGQSWGDDFALYIEQTIALSKGNIGELYLRNKFSMDNSVIAIGPYLYPFGFSVLLLPLYSGVGLNFEVLQLFGALFFIATIPFIYLVFKPLLKFKFSLIFLTAFVAIHFEYLIFCSNILSDLPFTFFCFLCLGLMQKETSYMRQFFLGLALYYSYFVKDAGIVLLPTLFIFQIQSQSNLIVQRKWAFLSIPYLVFAFGFFINSILLPNGNENQYKILFEHCNSVRLLNNMNYYFELISHFIFFFQLPVWASIIVFILIVYGILKSIKISPQLVVFCFALLMLLVAWPGLGGIRYLFPILPVVLFFILIAIENLISQFKVRSKFYFIALLLLLFITTIINITKIYDFSKQPINEAYTNELKIMYQFIKRNVNKNEAVVFYKPRALRLFTQRNSVYLDFETFIKSNFTFMLMEKEELYEIKTPLIQVFESGIYILVKKP